MSFQHLELASGAWEKLTFCEQMANIGSEVHRALKWAEKQRPDYANNAFERSLELLYLTIDDLKNRHRLKEITRLNEVWIDFFYGDNTFNSTAISFERYFLAWNYVARVRK